MLADGPDSLDKGGKTFDGKQIGIRNTPSSGPPSMCAGQVFSDPGRGRQVGVAGDTLLAHLSFSFAPCTNNHGPEYRLTTQSPKY